MTRQLTRTALSRVATLLVPLLAIDLFTVAKNLGWLSPLGITSESQVSQVVRAIERTQEVSLLSLDIQGARQENRSAMVFRKTAPGPEGRSSSRQPRRVAGH